MMNAEQDLLVHNGFVFDTDRTPIACLTKTAPRNKDNGCAKIIAKIEYHSGIHLAAFNCRRMENVACKQVACKLLREQCGYTLAQIGEVLRLDHSTIHYNLGCINRRLGHPSYKYLTNLYNLCNG